MSSISVGGYTLEDKGNGKLTITEKSTGETVEVDGSSMDIEKLAADLDAGNKSITNLKSVSTDSLNKANVASNGSELETLVSNLSDNDTIWLEPDTVYTVDNTLDASDASNWSLRSMAGNAWNYPIIRTSGNFPTMRIEASTPSDPSTWVNGWALEGLWFQPSHSGSDAIIVNGAKFVDINRCIIQSGGGTALRVGEQSGGIDRASEFAVRNSLIGTSGGTRGAYIGASSITFNNCVWFGDGNVAIEMEDSRQVWIWGGSWGSQSTCVSVRAPNRLSFGPHIYGTRAENVGSGTYLDVQATSGNRIEHVDCYGVRFREKDATGVKLRGEVDGFIAVGCAWTQGNGTGTCVDTGSGEPLGRVHISPNQSIRGGTFPVNDPDGHIWYGWDYGSAPNEFENVNGEIYHSGLNMANGWFIRSPSSTDAFQVWDDASNQQFTVDGSNVDFQGNTLKDPSNTGSSTDPRQDTTADNWLEVDIGGTTHYIPLYQ